MQTSFHVIQPQRIRVLWPVRTSVAPNIYAIRAALPETATPWRIRPVLSKMVGRYLRWEHRPHNFQCSPICVRWHGACRADHAGCVRDV
jgi:hypothetical protein